MRGRACGDRARGDRARVGTPARPGAAGRPRPAGQPDPHVSAPRGAGGGGAVKGRRRRRGAGSAQGAGLGAGGGARQSEAAAPATLPTMSGTRASNDRSSHPGGGLKRARSEPGGNKVTVVLGAQWGDEGKGKVVDLLATESDIVCRCQVGAGPGRLCPAAPPRRFPAPRFVLSSAPALPPLPSARRPPSLAGPLSLPCCAPSSPPPPVCPHLLPLLSPVGVLPPLPAPYSSSPSPLPRRAVGRERAPLGSPYPPNPPRLRLEMPLGKKKPRTININS